LVPFPRPLTPEEGIARSGCASCAGPPSSACRSAGSRRPGPRSVLAASSPASSTSCQGGAPPWRYPS